MKLILTVILSLWSIFISAQNIAPISSSKGDNLDFPAISTIQPIEPTFTSLGKYGVYGMNYSKGLPNITIPLYEIKSGDLTIPLILTYQGGGIKVSQEATWVGLGWDLSYGGQKTRVVNGFPDEVEPLAEQRPSATDIGNYIWENNTDMYNFYLQQLSSGTFDYSYAPDEFYYTIGSESGKYIGEGVEIMIPYQPIKIIPFSNQIINARGDLFSFTDGDVTKTRDASHSFPEYISAWYIEKIESLNKHVISYTYQPDGVFVNNKDLGYYESVLARYSIGQITQTTYHPMRVAGMPLTVTSRKPEYIYFDGGRLFFELSSREDITLKKLSSISIEYLNVNNAYTLLKKILFEYSYKDNRLMLDRVIERANDGSVKLIGEFEYDPTALPAKDSFNYDYSGYSNGEINSTPIPAQIFTDKNGNKKNIGGANKDAHESDAKGSILTTVKYPTGGKSVFTWENHKYSGRPINSYDIETYNNDMDSTVTLSVSTCNAEEEDMPHLVYPIIRDSLSCQHSYREFTCGETLWAEVTCNIGMTVGDNPLHEKYDWCILKIIDLTDNNKAIYTFSKRAKATVLRETANIQFKSGHRYSLSALTNCYNASGYMDVEFKQKRAVPPPQAGKRIFSYFGLRIKEITNYSSNDQVMNRKVFSYMQSSDTTRSSGYLANLDHPRYVLSKTGIKGIYHDKDCNLQETINTFFYDKPLAGLTPDNIYYEYVQVKDISSNGNNGVTKYQFRKSFDESFGIQVPLISTVSDRGQLLNEQIYDNRNNKMEETTFYYGIDSRIDKSSKGFKLLATTSLDDGGCSPIYGLTLSLSDMYIPVDYSYHMHWLRQDSIIKYEYKNVSNPIKTSTIYSYNDIKSCLPTKVTVGTSINSQKSIMTTKYPTQLSDPVSLAMTDKNFICQYIVKENHTDNILLSKQINKYSQGIGSTAGLFLLDSIMVQNGTMPAEKEVNISKYNGYNNILQYETHTKMPNVYLWGYKNKHVVAEIKNVTYAQVLEVLGQTLVDRVASASVPSDADILAINSLRNNTSILKDMQITTYTYRPLIGMLTSTSPSGVTTYYDYDLFGRLKETYIYKNNIVSTDNKQIIQSYNYHYQNQ